MGEKALLNRETPTAKRVGMGDLMDALITQVNLLSGDGILVDGNLALAAGVAKEKFDTTQTAYFRLAGVQYSKAAQADLTFTAAHTVNNALAAGTFWGAILIQVNAAGTISTKVVSADQAYASEALAINALPKPDAGKVALGHITINSKANLKWTANTDDMVNGSDVTTATFYDAAVVTYTAIDALD